MRSRTWRVSRAAVVHAMCRQFLVMYLQLLACLKQFVAQADPISRAEERDCNQREDDPQAIIAEIRKIRIRNADNQVDRVGNAERKAHGSSHENQRVDDVTRTR